MIFVFQGSCDLIFEYIFHDVYIFAKCLAEDLEILLGNTNKTGRVRLGAPADQESTIDQLFYLMAKVFTISLFKKPSGPRVVCVSPSSFGCFQNEQILYIYIYIRK